MTREVFTVKIVIDAMGGDNAPAAVVEGSVMALKEYDVELILTGDSHAIENELKKYDYDKSKIRIVHTTEVISTNEAPVMAIRRKKDSSMVVGMKIVKDGQADAFISAGSTGAILVGSLFVIGRLPGIDRPAIAPLLPGKKGVFMIIDAGANADCKPKNLVQFASMGSIYFKQILDMENPKVGLVNIGVEEEKGNELTKATYKLLKEADINFYGNIEPRDIPEGDVQVVVCDGFVGNIILKLYEGCASMMFSSLKEELMSNTISKFGALILKPSLKGLKKKFDYTEHGGAAFLGVNGGVIKAHGSSNGKAIKNAIRQAKSFIENNVLELITQSAACENSREDGLEE